MPDVIEHNIETGETVERSFTAEEIARREADRQASPPAIFADRDTIPADGATPATVTFGHYASAGTSVPYDVNGATGSLPLDADGIGELAVTSTTPGPVRVTAAGLELTITAEEV